MGHVVALCPKKAAEKRQEVETNLADYKKTGSCCQICAGVGLKCGDHRARHHALAAQDQVAVGSGTGANGNKGKETRSGNKGGAKGGGGTTAPP